MKILLFLGVAMLLTVSVGPALASEFKNKIEELITNTETISTTNDDTLCIKIADLLINEPEGSARQMLVDSKSNNISFYTELTGYCQEFALRVKNMCHSLVGKTRSTHIYVAVLIYKEMPEVLLDSMKKIVNLICNENTDEYFVPKVRPISVLRTIVKIRV